MPTKRTLRPRHTRDDIDDAVIHYLLHGELPAGASVGALRLVHPDHRVELRDVWTDVGRELVTEWIESRPGTRPWAFWEFQTRSPRKILGGAGVVAHEHYAYAPSSDFGIPFLMDLRSGDPPVVESQTAYLKRTRRLTADEKRRLKKRDYEPEILGVDPDSDLDDYTGEEFEKLRPYLCTQSGGIA